MMQIRNSSDRYGLVAQLLHWSIVALIVAQFVLASQAEDAGSLLQKARILTSHKSVGISILMLAVVRLLWRLGNPVPASPPGSKPWQNGLASAVHWALYALIVLTPLAGWLMSSAKNYPVSWFGLFTLPDMVSPDKSLFETFKEAHEILAFSILMLALLHIAAALKHHFLDRDNVLRRMLPVKLK